MLRVEEMTPEQKLGFVICAKTTSEDNIQFFFELLEKNAGCCVQVLVNDRAKGLIEQYRSKVDYPILVVNDMEEGYVNSSVPRLPMCTLGAANNPEYTKAFAGILAKQAREDGFSGCWGPVIDLAYTANCPFGNTRVISDSVEGMMPFARDILSVFKSYHFQGCAKHYPGGPGAPDTPSQSDEGSVDNHIAPTASQMSEEVLRKHIRETYLTLWNEGLMPSIMVSHTDFPNIDPVYPASISKKIIGMLRDEGYDGLIYTDSFSMLSIRQRFGSANAMVAALNAGVDVILPNNNVPARENYQMLVDAYYAGQIDENMLNNAVRRIISLSQWCAEEPQQPYSIPEDMDGCVRNIIRDSITAQCADGVSPAVDPDEKRLFVVLERMRIPSTDGLNEVTLENTYDENRVIKAIKANFPNAEIVTTPEYPWSTDTHKVMQAVVRHEKCIVVTFSSGQAFLGVDCLTRRTEAMIKAIALGGKLEGIVHIGNPFALNTIPYCDRKLLGYRTGEAQDYIFEVLAGKYPARGVLPFPKLQRK